MHSGMWKKIADSKYCAWKERNNNKKKKINEIERLKKIIDLGVLKNS